MITTQIETVILCADALGLDIMPGVLSTGIRLSEEIRPLRSKPILSQTDCSEARYQFAKCVTNPFVGIPQEIIFI